HPGRMTAFLGATNEQADDACAAAEDACWIANDNAPGQIVVAGTADGVTAATARAKQIGVKRASPLNVGGAFHTPLMRDASDGLGEVLASVDFAAPRAPVVVNEDAAAYDDGGNGWRARLAAHVSVPVRWRTSQETLAGLGATEFVEVGHGTMLAALAKRTVPDIPVRNVAVPGDLPARTSTHA
ncbi:MAG: ACP S-malonyltransferase, partial [Acidimicrobiia bacterium]